MSACRKCGDDLTPGGNWGSTAAKKHDYICRGCVSDAGRAYYRANREHVLTAVKTYRDAHKEQLANYRLQYHYGITAAKYNAMLEVQGGCCAICGKTPEENERKLSVDHDHATGEVRGLLCSNCNRGIGLLQDSPELCELAVLYLKTPTGV